jgi:tetratricopeptide (TPR) repeat protein
MDEHTKQLLLLGREHYQRHEFEKAEEALREVLKRDDRVADVHDMLGIIFHLRGNLSAAERHFERALAINPAYTEAALNLAVTYNDRGRYEAARQLYARFKIPPVGAAPGLDPFARGKIANMHAEVGEAYADAGLLREAVAEYEKAVVLGPHFADLRTRLGSLFRAQNDLSHAREQYEAAIETRPSYVPARMQLGVTLLSMGESGAAVEEWRRVLEIDPDNARAKMYLRVVTQARADDSEAMPGPPAPDGAEDSDHRR